MTTWPEEPGALIALQEALARAAPDPWRPGPAPLRVGGVFVCFGRGGSGPGSRGDPGWAGAAVMERRRLLGASTATGKAGAPYVTGMLALREGPLLEAAARGLTPRPEVLIVNASGRDHPRRCGLALHLGAILDWPTVGVTWRPLFAAGDPPGNGAGATSLLNLDGETVAAYLRARHGVHPLVVHPGWRTDLDTALAVVRACILRAVTPEPLRQARRLARTARATAVSAPSSRPGEE